MRSRSTIPARSSAAMTSTPESTGSISCRRIRRRSRRPAPRRRRFGGFGHSPWIRNGSRRRVSAHREPRCNPKGVKGLFRALPQGLLRRRLTVFGCRWGFRDVLGDVNGPALPDYSHLDLPGVLELVFDLARDLVRQQYRLVVVDLLRLHDHPDLTAGLQGVDLFDAHMVAGQLLESLQALDVVLEALAAGSGTRGRDGVCGDQQDRLDRLRLHLVMVRLDRMHDRITLAVAPGELGRDGGVGALDLVGQRLAEVVQEARPARRLDTRVELRGHDPS